MNMWQQKGKAKKRLSFRWIIIIIGGIIFTALLIVACIFALLHSEYSSQINEITEIVGVALALLTIFLTIFLQAVSSKEAHKEAQDIEEDTLASDSTPPAINQPSQEVRAHISSTQPLENEPVSVSKTPASVVTAPLSTSTLFYQPADIFQFNENILKASDFYGRKEAIETLLNRTRTRNSTSIIGPVHIGKSWLVDYLKFKAETEISQNVCIGIINAQSASCSSIENFTEQAILKLNGSIDPQLSYADLTFLEKTVEKLIKNNRRPILCIDKFEGFSDRKVFDLDFFKQLRAIAQKGLVLITVSKVPLIDILGDYGSTSGLFNIIEQIKLKPFTREEAKEFITSKSEHVGFTSKEQEALLRYGQIEKEQWPPIRLQLVGKELLSDKVYNPSSYQPDDQTYWKHFKQRIEDKYRGIGG